MMVKSASASATPLARQQDDLRRKVVQLSDAYRTAMSTRPSDAGLAYGAWLAAFHTVTIVKAGELRPAPNLNHCLPESRARMRRAFERQQESSVNGV